MNQQGASDWPALPLDEWQETYATLHLWTQIVGKVRLALSKWVNHYWHITLYVTSRGLSTSPIPHGRRIFQIDFDFIDHELVIHASDGQSGRLKLQAQSVATFYTAFMAELERLELPVELWTMPSEIADAIPFEEDEQHSAYDPDSPIVSGASCFRRTVSSNAFVQISSESAVQFNSTGEQPIWR